jgi:hypothetical protein
VYIDGRWRRLNYDNLGQNTLDANLLGLMSHVHTFTDHAQAGLITWGQRDNNSTRTDICGYANPYSCISLSDRFGPHCKLDNPPAQGALTRMTISKVYWYHEQGDAPFVQMRLDDPEAAGHLIVHVDETPDEAREAFVQCYEMIDKAFVLRAEGQPEVKAIATRGYWIDTRKDMKEFYIQIPAQEFERMPFDVAYQLVPVKTESKDGPVWSVKEGITVTRRK